MVVNTKRVLTLEELQIPELQNETRLAALYGRIPSVEVDAIKRTDMLKFWETAIGRFCEVRGSSVFTIEELQHAFKTKEGITPLSLRTVVKLLLNKSETSSSTSYVRDEREFLEPLSSASWSSSSSDALLSSTLISAFRGLTSWLTSTVKAKISRSEDDDEEEQEHDDVGEDAHRMEDQRSLVWVARVKSATERVVKALRHAQETTSGSSSSSLFTFDDFQTTATKALSTASTSVGGAATDDMDALDDDFVLEQLQLVLAHLVRSKQVTLYWKNDNQQHRERDDRFLGIKLLPSSPTPSSTPSSSSVSDNDRSVLLLKHTIRSLEKQIVQLENDCEKCRDAARQLLTKKRKNEAVLQLQRQKQLKALLEKRSSALYNLQTVLETIEQTQTDHEVYEAIVEGTKTLKAMQENVKVDEVEDAMLELEETLANQQEIDEVFTKSVATSVDVNDEELEQELEMLASQSQLQVEEETTAPMEKAQEDVVWPTIPKDQIEETTRAEVEEEETKNKEKEPVTA